MINTLKSIVNLQGITVMSDIKNWKKLIENIQMNETDEEDANYTDHEVSMAKSQLLSSVKSSTRIAKHLSGKSEDEGIPGWVASKLTVAEDYLQAVADYMDGEELQEGYKVMPPMDPKYVARSGLEGPFTTLSGKVVYYDPKEGKYYDPDTDIYLSYDEFQNYDKDYSDMKDERDETRESEEENKESSNLKSIVHKHLSKSFSDASDSGANKEQFADYMMNSINELIEDQVDATFENNLQKTNDPLTLAIRNEIDAIIEFSNLNKGDAESVMTYISDMVSDIAEEWEAMQKEGNEFSGALANAKKFGKKEFSVDGKTYKVKEVVEEETDDVTETKYGIVRYPDTAISYIKNDGNGWEHIFDKSYGFEGPVDKADLQYAKKINKEKIPSRMFEAKDTCDCGCNCGKDVCESCGKKHKVIESKEMMTEAQFDEAAGEKDACYRKVKSRYKVWPSAYASGALVKCRKVGASNWGNSKK